MPEADGFAVLECRNSDAATHSIQVVVVPAKNLKETDRQRLSGRVEGLILKGVLKQEKLLEDMATALSKLNGDRRLARRSACGCASPSAALGAVASRRAVRPKSVATPF